MLQSLLPVYYVQLSPAEVSVLNVKSNVRVRDLPEVALSPGATPSVLAVGRAARQAAAQSGGSWANPFGHPRSLVSDFVLAEAVLKHFVIQAAPAGWKRLMTPSPRMVIHPSETRRADTPRWRFVPCASWGLRRAPRTPPCGRADL